MIWAPRRETASAISAASRENRAQLAGRGLHVAELVVSADMFRQYYPELEMDQDAVVCLRSCLIKPEHDDWIDTIAQLITDVL